jgi:hypothetical protein
LALRNSISRSREFGEKLLELKIEESVRIIMNTQPQVQEEAKALLRDLGCQLELKELWTGSGVAMTN